MKKQEDKQLRNRVFKYLLPTLLALFFPAFTLITGMSLYLAYLSMSLIAVLPAITLPQFCVLAIPFAAIDVKKLINKAFSYSGKKKLLKSFQKNNA